MPSSISSLIKCHHTNHLFNAPLCKRQPLWKRIASIAFHVITLCIPLILYYLIFCCSSKKRLSLSASSSLSSSKELGSKFSFISIDLDNDDEYVENTSSFVDDLLKHNIISDRKGLQWHGIDITPSDGGVQDVIVLYWQQSFQNFEKALKAYPGNPWKNKDVLKAASELLRVGSVVAERVFQNLPVSQEHMRKVFFLDKPYIDAIMNPKHYAYYAVYYCANVYIWMKCGLVYDPIKSKLTFSKERTFKEKLESLQDGNYILLKDLGVDEADEFYQPDTPQNKFRLLYNAYCDKFDNAVKSDPNFNPEIKFNVPLKDDGLGMFKVSYNMLSNMMFYKNPLLIQR